MTKTIQGGCGCGAVRYELRSDPFDAGWCHCRTCQLSSGAPAMAFATVTAGDLVFVRGEERVKRFDSSSFGHRRFCGDCGTPLTIEVAHQPETVDFTIATLDDPGLVPPGFHIFRSSRVAWFETADELPRHDRFRPGTRGLEGTEPPRG
ncbi:MAG TPA: GFA family protein [Allosphingosinicella sp.]|nr:GFA family protein [Allosphingosinicella sp.]